MEEIVRHDTGGNGLDANGRFAKGNKLGKGNPHLAKINTLKAAMYECVTASDWREIVEKAVNDAKAGDKAAREWLSDRMLGKATLPIDATVNHGVSHEDAVQTVQAFFGLTTETK